MLLLFTKGEGNLSLIFWLRSRYNLRGDVNISF